MVAYIALVYAIPLMHKPKSIHSIAGYGINENTCKTFSPNLASGLFLIRPGFKIEINGNFFSFRSFYIYPLVLIYRNIELGSPPPEDTTK